MLRKLLKILVSVVVSTTGVGGRILDQSDTLEPLREVGRLEGICAVKRHPIPLVLEVVGNKKKPELWGCCVKRVDSQRARSPFGIIASSWGGLLLRENEQQ